MDMTWSLAVTSLIWLFAITAGLFVAFARPMKIIKRLALFIIYVVGGCIVFLTAALFVAAVFSRDTDPLGHSAFGLLSCILLPSAALISFHLVRGVVWSVNVARDCKVFPD